MKLEFHKRFLASVPYELESKMALTVPSCDLVHPEKGR